MMKAIQVFVCAWCADSEQRFCNMLLITRANKWEIDMHEVREEAMSQREH